MTQNRIDRIMAAATGESLATHGPSTMTRKRSGTPSISSKKLTTTASSTGTPYRTIAR